MPIGPPGNDGIDELENCLRLHTAIGENASVALDRLPCRKDDANLDGALRGSIRDTSIVACHNLQDFAVEEGGQDAGGMRRL